MAQVHLMLQYQGGVGKTLAVVALADWLQAQGAKPLCLGVSGMSESLCRIERFSTKRVPVCDDLCTRVTHSGFKRFLEAVSLAEPEQAVLADADSAASGLLVRHLRDFDGLETIREQGHIVVLHTILVGGGRQEAGERFLRTLLRRFPEAPVVVWTNAFYGSLDGILDFRTCVKHRNQLVATLDLPHFHELQDLNAAKLLLSRAFRDALTAAAPHFLDLRRTRASTHAA